jgi:hypothetical protein
MKKLIVALLFISSFAFAQTPHTLYGPVSVGMNQVIKVSLDTRCNVLVLDNYNYDRYKNGLSYKYFGGYATKSPVILKPPTGRYYVVIDNGGDSYKLRAAVQVISLR